MEGSHSSEKKRPCHSSDMHTFPPEFLLNHCWHIQHEQCPCPKPVLTSADDPVNTGHRAQTSQILEQKLLLVSQSEYRGFMEHDAKYLGFDLGICLCFHYLDFMRNTVPM